ncbi:hypothetical protein V6N11_056208 [Hibiscus sabdariffa]|uniref:Transposase, Ptta/En/Spm, plant n=1 Tax=Hibiscus sabdariffa TaxID=183260 RepID=A0ABR2T3H1_9ROSI
MTNYIGNLVAAVKAIVKDESILHAIQMTPGKLLKKRARTQSTCKHLPTQNGRQSVQELQQVSDALDHTQEHEVQHISNATNQPNEENDLDTTVENSEPIDNKRVRGPSRGKGLENLIKGKNKLLVEIPEGKGRPIDAIQSAKLSSEIGIISRQFISIPTKWKEMKDDAKFHALERLNSKFEMKFDDDYVKSSVMSIMSKLSRNHRHKVHLHFKTFPNADVARQNKPTKYNLTQENWEQLCDLFSDPKYQEKMVELQSTPVEEGTEPKTIDDIMDEVLGTRSGYIPGLGYGPKPNKKSSSADRINLGKRLKNKEDELNACKSNFEVLQTQMDAMRSALLAAGIQVPPLQFPAPNNTPNSSSSGSQPTQNLD